MSDCPRCGAAKHKGRCKGSKAAVKAPPPPIKLNGHLEVAAGLGFRASIEEGQFCIEQDRQEGETIYTHQLTLAPHEAARLIEWVQQQVEGKP